MITAKIASEIVQKTIEMENAKARAKAEEYCEELSAQIEINAYKKFSNLIVEIPLNVKRQLVLEILKDNGFYIRELDTRKISIEW